MQIDFTQERHATIGTDVTALEIGFDFASSEGLKPKGLLDTACHAAAGVCV